MKLLKALPVFIESVCTAPPELPRTVATPCRAKGARAAGYHKASRDHASYTRHW